ncbi:MAG: TetR/AcrR family transcriptional regulator [Polyangiales bacterium]
MSSRVPTQHRAHETRASLVSAAEREFSKRGYAATTAKTIAERAKTATGSFYQYFESKDHVLREIAARRQADVVTHALAEIDFSSSSSLVASARHHLRGVVDVVMAYHASDKGLHAVLTERRHADAELDAITAAGERSIVERIADLLARWNFQGDRLATAFVLFGAVEGAVHAHVLGDPVVDDARFVDARVEALLRIALPVSPIPQT